MSQPLKIAYVAEGKLFLVEDGRAAAEVASPFVDSLLERAQRERDRDSWKEDSFGWNTGTKLMPGLRGLAPMPGTRRVHYTGVSRGGEGELVYALDTSVTAGLFCLSVAEKSERRLFHKQGFRARDLTRRGDGTLAMSVRNDDGTASIATMAAEGRGLRPLTEGDVIDEQPSWVGESDGLVYQSAGVGRNQQGVPVATGPYSIVRLDVKSGEVETLVERDGFDCLSPRVVGGDLYYIRRPYQGLTPVSPWKVAVDMVMFPYRVVRALVHFLDFFSMVFAKKPLMTAGGPRREGPDQRSMMLWGKMIDAEKAMRKKGENGPVALVPKEWELVKRDLGTGREETVARSVLAFDVSGDVLAYSNGSGVFVGGDGSGGKERLVASGRLIERVVVV